MEPFPRKPRSRVLHAQVEADAELHAAMNALESAAMRCVEAHAACKKASRQLVEANRIVSHADLVEREMACAT